jgi:hypothetical protein
MMPELTTEERHLNALNLWNERGEENPPSLMELIKAAYPERDDIDGRSKEARELKSYLATLNIQPLGAHVYQPKDEPQLTEEQKEYIANNANLMSEVHMARIIFENESITNLHIEARIVRDHIQTLDPNIVLQTPSEVPEGEYAPPKTFDKSLLLVNRYIYDKIDKKKITSRQRKEISALMGYINTYRFVHQVNTYTINSDRVLFESSFVRYTYNKADLTQEEVDQYIVLATEVVIGSSIQARSERLQELLDTTAEDSEGRRVAMGLVQAISAAQTEYNQCVGRQNKLLESLKEKRSDRLKNQIKANASVLSLVEMWKDEESRKKLIKIAETRKKAVKEEINKLSSMDDIKARIMGISEDEVLNG